MAINQYKFYGVTLTTTDETTLLTPSAAGAGAVETFIIKSFRELYQINLSFLISTEMID